MKNQLITIIGLSAILACTFIYTDNLAYAEQTTEATPEVNTEEILAAAQAGDPRAQYNVGVMYQSGIGVNTNMPLALQWYHKAAAQNEENAQYNLGVIYLQGIGVEKNQDTAIGWFEKSAAQLNPSAIRVLELLSQESQTP